MQKDSQKTTKTAKIVVKKPPKRAFKRIFVHFVEIFAINQNTIYILVSLFESNTTFIDILKTTHRDSSRGSPALLRRPPSYTPCNAFSKSLRVLLRVHR